MYVILYRCMFYCIDIAWCLCINVYEHVIL